jgi:hypothetical protein
MAAECWVIVNVAWVLAADEAHSQLAHIRHELVSASSTKKALATNKHLIIHHVECIVSKGLKEEVRLLQNVHLSYHFSEVHVLKVEHIIIVRDVVGRLVAAAVWVLVCSTSCDA